jgi:2-isopropylmalate synthase
MRLVDIYDTTLRDGSQAENINLSIWDKIRISQRLDELGIHYIEGGWPGSSPKDEQFFREIKNYAFSHAQIAAFGSTHHAHKTPETDNNIKAILFAKTDVVTLFGKTWDVHVRDALQIDLKRNLEIIHDSLAYVRSHVSKVFFDAEHFFDGFKANPEYALKAIGAALNAGSDCIVLCDTNGGTLPTELREIIRAVKKRFKGINLGIHTHNDSELAVANTIEAVALGVNHVQGTINGYGERCGNANLCSIIPNLKLKLKVNCISDARLKKLSEISRFVDELANITPNRYQPYVGNSAFAHKGGIHTSAVEKNPETYEHIRPDSVGNIQRVLISDQAGKSAVLRKAREYGLDVSSKDPVVSEIVQQLKELENQGFQFEGAEASFEQLMKRALGTQKRYFELLGFRVIDEKSREGEQPSSEATVMVKVGGKIEHTAAVGNGPVNALDNAIRKALERFYPELKEVKLYDYKVRVLPGNMGTGSKVRVLIESGDKDSKWGTVGVSDNIIEASWQALTDSINYKFLKDEKKASKK